MDGEPRTRAQASIDVVARHEAAALAALDVVSGGVPLCRVDGSRQSVKAGEGAVVALAEVRRALRDGGETGAADSVIADVRARWSEAVGPLAARPGSDEYRKGGLAALSSLSEDLRHERPDVPSLLADGPALEQPVVVQHTESGDRRWPRRRRVVAVAVLLALVALVAMTAGWPLAEAPLWSMLTAGTVVLSSLALALYVPRAGEGWRPDLGCAPCAAAGLALAIAGPWLAIETAPQAGRAALAAALAGAALIRKVTEPRVCATP